MDLLALSKQEVRKHVGAIHVKGRLSLLQRKLYNVLLVNAYEDLITERRHKARVSHLAQVTGFNSNNYRFLQNTLRSLAQTTVEWNILHDGKDGEWGITSLLASAKISRGWCVYEFSAELAEKLFNPEVYARINLQIQRSFKSSYGLALYENCVRFRNTKNKTTGEKSLETWRDLLGVEDGTHEDYRNFRRRVLDPAIKEVNEFSDIHIKVHPQRKGRKVIGLRFDVRDNPQLTIDFDGDPRKPVLDVIVEDDESYVLPSSTYERLVSFGLEKKAASLVKEYDHERIAQNLDIVQARLEAGEEIKSITAYALDAIKKDYRPKKTKIEAEIDASKADQKEEKARQLKAKQEQEERKKREEKQRKDRLDKAYANMPAEKKEELERRILERMEREGGLSWQRYLQEKKEGKTLDQMTVVVRSTFKEMRRELVGLEMSTV